MAKRPTPSDVKQRYSASTKQIYAQIAAIIDSRKYKGALTEVSINGPGNVFVWVAGKGYERLPVRDVEFVTERYVRDLCASMAANLGLNFSEQHMPILACRTPDGGRFQANIGAHIRSRMAVSIRIPRKKNATFDDFEVTEEQRALITETVLAGKCILLSGSTNSGKTTFQNLLIQLIPLDHRVITIEDVPEIDMPHENGFGILLERNEGFSPVGWNAAIDSTLRHNPDSIFPGELSITNAFPILQAMDTGHESVITTMHANSPMDALRGFRRRVGLAGGPSSELESVFEFLADTVGLIIQLKHVKGQNKERRVVTDVVAPKDLLNSRASRLAFARDADNVGLSPEEQTQLYGRGQEQQEQMDEVHG